MSNQKTKIPDELKSIIYDKFGELPIESKLVVYARLAHGNMFKAQNNDLFGLNRRVVSKIYRSFIDSLKSEYAHKIGTKSRSRFKTK
jgi:hypothetical protein